MISTMPYSSSPLSTIRGFYPVITDPGPDPEPPDLGIWPGPGPSHPWIPPTERPPIGPDPGPDPGPPDLEVPSEPSDVKQYLDVIKSTIGAHNTKQTNLDAIWHRNSGSVANHLSG
jgi:hypothetical protein